MKLALSICCAVLTFALDAGVAHAQDCGGGRVRVSGRCCWPGQEWDPTARVCTGVPHCPSGLVESGEDCVAYEAPAPTPAATSVIEAAPSPPTARPWPVLGASATQLAIDPEYVDGVDTGLLVAGIVLTGLALVGGIVAIVGGVVDPDGAGGTNGLPQLYIPGGAVAAVAAAIGLPMLIVALAVPTQRVASGSAAARLSLRLGAPAAQLGATLSLSF